jgi:hypothetical protein
MRLAKDRNGWLDSLARWSARDSDAGRPAAAGGGGAPAFMGGTTRRTALRGAAAAGAAALLGPMRLLEPSSAAAATTHEQECRAEAEQNAFDDFEACFATPFADYATADDNVHLATKQLRSAKTAAERARLRKLIQSQTKLRRKASKQMEFCNKAYLSDQAEGAVKCQAANPPPGQSGGGTKAPGCESGSLLCGEECCDLQFAFCQGCAGSPICCRINGNCCPRVE